MAVTQNDIQAFLNDFLIKMNLWGIVFRDDRGKNFQTLFELGISQAYRKDILKKLAIEDYSEGPLSDNLHGGFDMWVFGKIVKGKEVYIKITMGIKGAQVICISFHIAEYPMTYPFKKI